MARRWITRSEEETRELGRRLAEEKGSEALFLLEGELGAGKTVFARGVAEALGIDPREVQSPTFIVAREHRGGDGATRMIHVDLYRLDPEDVEAAGLDELLAYPVVRVVEWADRLPFRIAGAVALCLSRRPDGAREVSEGAREQGGRGR